LDPKLNQLAAQPVDGRHGLLFHITELAIGLSIVDLLAQRMPRERRDTREPFFGRQGGKCRSDFGTKTKVEALAFGFCCRFLTCTSIGTAVNAPGSHSKAFSDHATKGKSGTSLVHTPLSSTTITVAEINAIQPVKARRLFPRSKCAAVDGIAGAQRGHRLGHASALLWTCEE
jgi:hypothetical protein